MPTKTVEYEEKVTREEELIICSDCGREVDDRGESFDSQYGDIDFCSECISKYCDMDSEYVERVEEWHDKKDSAGDSMLKNIKTVKLASVGAVVLSGALGLILILNASAVLLTTAYTLLLVTLFFVIVFSSSLMRPSQMED